MTDQTESQSYFKKYKIFNVLIVESLYEKISNTINGCAFIFFLTLSNTFLIYQYLGNKELTFLTPE